MNEAIINGEIRLEYRGGFSIMNDEALKKHFGVSGDNWGIYDPEQHTIISFAWNKVGGFMSWLADPKGVANSIDKKMRDNLRAYERTSDIAMNICGRKAEGFTFEYIAGDADIKQVGKILSFKIGKCFYVIQFVTREEQETQAYIDFDSIIGTARMI